VCWTAPAQVGVAPGFVQRAMLEAPLEAPTSPEPSETPESPSEEKTPQASPKKGPLGVVHRPGLPLQDWPLFTPSPTGASMFSAARYQLFGGPAPLQEATHFAMGPTVGQHVGAGFLATSGPHGTHQPVSGRQPLSYGASTFSGCAGFVPAGQAPQVSLARSAAGPPPVPLPPGAAPTVGGSRPLSRVEQGDDEEEDDDSDGEGQQQQQPHRSPEDIPKPPPGALHPSIGSENHAEGTCKRCCFFPRNRCNNGYECDFCHCEHEKRKRKNKKSKKKNKEGCADAVGGGTAPSAAAFGGTAPSGNLASAGSPTDVWSTSYGAGGAQAQQTAALPPVVYENTDGVPQWTYQWIDDPCPFPGQFPEPPANYFAAATGLLQQQQQQQQQQQAQAMMWVPSKKRLPQQMHPC